MFIIINSFISITFYDIDIYIIKIIMSIEVINDIFLIGL